MRRAGVLAVLLAAAAAAAPAHAARPLPTAVNVQEGEISGSAADAAAFFRRIRDAGATAVRLTVAWDEVATKRPAHPADPQAHSYHWDMPDRNIKLAVAAGLKPLIGVAHAPAWAGGRHVNLAAFAQFATALTKRYSGSLKGLPRVRTWLVWNEPNLSKFFYPQVVHGKLVGAARYRLMLNDFSRAAHRVHRDNVVVGGLVAPFTFRNDPGPLAFMAAVLCMSDGRRPRPICSARTHIDAWSVHPYTSGGPQHHALRKTDISLGDLPKARRLLDAAARAHHVVSRNRVQFWVTEFSWDSNPPDPQGVPIKLQAQWVSDALCRAWEAGVSLFTWYQLRDAARPSPFQSGLYFGSWKAKPALTAFRFPFVALRRARSVHIWGRTPGGKPAWVAIERSSKSGWRRVATLRANRFGIVSRTLRLRLRASTFMRARGAGSTSIAYPLKPPPDRFFNPFGS